MRLRPTSLSGCVVVELEPYADERGWFARTYDAAAWAVAGLEATVAECNSSFNAVAGTLRGLHHQLPPHDEAKLVRCTRGALFDVMVDIRPDSPTFGRWHAETLTPDGGIALFSARGFTHGFLTLEDATEITYQISTPYEPAAARGVRWNDAVIGIDWPSPPIVLSERDATLPLLRDAEAELRGC